jgi:1-acyl-sn-glycerol-3-phosphate acyltransferase
MAYLFRAAFVLSCTAFWATIASVIALVDRSGESVIWMARLWARWNLSACRIRVVVEGLSDVRTAEPQVFMSNHQSQFDILALVSTLPVSFRFIAKKELTRIPFFGWALVLGGHVVVDRGNRAKAVSSLQRASDQIRGGTNVIIFPEGTRSRTGTLRRFKSGGFHLARNAGVAIVPVSISGSLRVTPKGSLKIEPGVIKVVYGAPIPTEGLTLEERGALKQRVRDAIEAGLDPALQRSEGPHVDVAA